MKKQEKKFACPFTHPQIERVYAKPEHKVLMNEDTQPNAAPAPAGPSLDAGKVAAFTSGFKGAK